MRKLIELIMLGLFCGSVFPQWIKQPVNSQASFRGLSVVNERVIWASGTGGTVVRTADGGKTWDVFTIPGAEKLDLRDIEAFDAETAYALSIGNGDNSRIYKSVDGGKTWKEQFRNKDEKAFFDAIACWDRSQCIAMSDPVNGKYVLIATSNGTDWLPLDTEKMPSAEDGEAAFAASGTCLIAYGAKDAYLVSGGTNARVFRSSNRGASWLVTPSPIVHGTSGSGIFSIAMRDPRNGVIVGGNYERPEGSVDNIAFTSDGGRSWKKGTGLSGYRSGVAFVDRDTIITVGTNGTDISTDGGRTWKRSGSENLNVVQAKGAKAVWAAGPKGLIVKLG